ncbi:MAG TPA: fumarylacetoacetate hydrolase family protein [Acidimicrobiales bacterium]
MRFATVRTASGTSAARLDGDDLVLLKATDVGALLAEGDLDRAGHDESGGSVKAADADFATLVTRPSKVFCVGLNYRSHILETGNTLPEYPTLFAKFTAALIGAHDDIILPSVSQRADWEVEICVVIGSPLRHASREEAQLGIAGYTVLNDISIRDYQRRTSQWLQGKTFENTTPVGPYLVTGDEIGEGLDLEVRCEVDGQVMQLDRTSELVFGALDVVTYCSDVLTLQPGDLLSLGTTGGVGDARDPKVSLRAGQVVRTSIEGIGECVNTCVDEVA